MLSARFKPWHVPIFLAKYAYLSARRRPLSVTFEVTMRCNARCSFCDYWKTSPDAKRTEVASFADAARRFNPLIITFSGGEPTLRRDLEQLVGAVAGAVRVRFMSLITHGAMLTAERARALWDAGINQFNISLDYLDGRHDVARGIPGLTQKILTLVPRMQANGIDNVRFNTVVKDDNLDQILPIVRQAEAMGAGVNLSVYTDSKNGNRDHLLNGAHLRALDALVHDLLVYKRRRNGVIINSDYYLEQIPRYARGEMREPCQAGIRQIHVTPTGHVKRCPDFAPDFHWTDYSPYREIDCNACYYACRGEAQAPLRLSRVRDVMATK